MRKLLLLLASLLVPGLALAACPSPDFMLLPTHLSVLNSASDYSGSQVVLELDPGPSYSGGSVELAPDSNAGAQTCSCSDQLCITPGYYYRCPVVYTDLWPGTHTFEVWQGGILCMTKTVKVKHMNGLGLKDTVGEKFVDYNSTTNTQDVTIKVVNSAGDQTTSQKYDVFDDFNKLVMSHIITSSPCSLNECLDNSNLVYAEPLLFPNNFLITQNDPTYNVSFQVQGGQVKTLDYQVRNAPNEDAEPLTVQLAGCGYEIDVSAPQEDERFHEGQETGIVRFRVLKDDDAVFAPNVDASLRNASTGEEIDVQVTYRADNETYEGAFIFGGPGTYELRVIMKHTVCGDFEKLVTFYKGGPQDGSTTAATGFDSASLFVVALLIGVMFFAKFLVNKKN